MEKGTKKQRRVSKKKTLLFSINYTSLIFFFISLLDRNAINFFSETVTFEPSLGFLAVLSFLVFVENEPKPLISILPLDARESVKTEIIFSNNFSTSLVGK